MRGRKPRWLMIATQDMVLLQHVARSRTLVSGPACPDGLSRGRRLIDSSGSLAPAMRPVYGLAHLSPLRTRRRPALAVGSFAVRTSPADFPPLQRAQIVQLACLEPIAKGLHITHWTGQDLAHQAVAEGIVPHVSASTIRRILRSVDLQPRRTRYWKTARLPPVSG